MVERRVKVVLASSLILLLVAAFGFGFVLGNPGATTSYVLSGVYPGAPTYTIWKESSTYYAKDSYGQIPSWGESSNASFVVQSSLDTATKGSVLICDLLTMTHEVSIDMGNDGIVLYGLSMNTTGFVASASFTGDALLKVKSGQNVQIHDLRFFGSAQDEQSPMRASHSKGADYGIYVDGFDVKNIHIDNVYVSYFAKNCIYFNGNEVSWITNSIAVESFEHCVHLQDATNFHLEGLEVGGSLTGDGYHFVYAREGQIVDCSSYWNGNVTNYGYDAGSGYSIVYKSRGLVFTNCESEDNWWDGFQIYGGGTAADRPGNITFNGCRAIRNGQNGVDATKGFRVLNATYVLIDGCQAYDDCLTTGYPSATPLQDSGISVWGANNNYIMISGCMTFGNVNQGIEIVPGGSNVQVYCSLNQTAYVAAYP